MKNTQNKLGRAIDDNNSDNEVWFIVELRIHVWKAITDKMETDNKVIRGDLY